MNYIFRYNSYWYLLSSMYFPLNCFLQKGVWRLSGFWDVLVLYKLFINPNPTELGFQIVEVILPNSKKFSASPKIRLNKQTGRQTKNY